MALWKKFGSLNMGTVFETSAQAKCKCGNDEHKSTVPAEAGTCGFYGLMDPTLLPRRTHLVAMVRKACLLQVSFSGKVVPGADGYRAEQQDVLTVWINRRCIHCKNKAWFVAATDEKRTFGKKPSFYMVPICHKHRNKYRQYYTLAELRGMLGTDVFWLETVTRKVKNRARRK